MRKSIMCGCGIMVAALVIGCGSSSSPSPEAVIKEQLSIQAQMTGIMEKVTGKKSFEEAQVKVKELAKRSNDLARGFTEDQLERAAEKLKRESEASFKKYEAAYKEALMKVLFDKKP